MVKLTLGKTWFGFCIKAYDFMLPDFRNRLRNHLGRVNQDCLPFIVGQRESINLLGGYVFLENRMIIYRNS